MASCKCDHWPIYMADTPADPTPHCQKCGRDKPVPRPLPWRRRLAIARLLLEQQQTAKA